MADTDEHRRRRQAITWYEQGVSFTEIIRRLERSREWLAKWLRRYRELGWEGLQDRSRAPHTRPRRIPEWLERAILQWRQRLDSVPCARGVSPEWGPRSSGKRCTAAAPSRSPASRPSSVCCGAMATPGVRLADGPIRLSPIPLHVPHTLEISTRMTWWAPVTCAGARRSPLLCPRHPGRGGARRCPLGGSPQNGAGALPALRAGLAYLGDPTRLPVRQ